MGFALNERINISGLVSHRNEAMLESVVDWVPTLQSVVVLLRLAWQNMVKGHYRWVRQYD